MSYDPGQRQRYCFNHNYLDSSPCLNKSGINIWEMRWPATSSIRDCHVTHGNELFREAMLDNARCLVGPLTVGDNTRKSKLPPVNQNLK